MTFVAFRKTNKFPDRPPKKTLPLGTTGLNSVRSYILFLRDAGIMFVVLPFAVLAVIGIFTIAAVGEFVLSLGAWATRRPDTTPQDSSSKWTEGSSHGSS